jgi:hypothetical protein
LTLCSTEDSFELPENNQMCKVVCIEAATGTSSAIQCEKYMIRLNRANNPIVILAVTAVAGMILLTCLGWFLSRVFKNYRYKLELYQHLLVEFIPDKMSEVAVKYQPSLDIIEDVTSEDYESSVYNTGRKTNMKSMKSEELRGMRISTEKSKPKSNYKREIDNIFTQPSFNRKRSFKNSSRISGRQMPRTNDVAFLTQSRDPSVQQRVVFSIRNNFEGED